MADVRPFRGLRHNQSLIAHPGDVLCPPYDVISREEQSRLYGLSPYNIVRLEFGQESPEDTPSNNRYTRASALFQEWLNKDVLVPEKQPAFYLLRQDYSCDGRRRARRGLVACVRLEEWDKRIIRPHEKTAQKPKADRLELMLACHTNFSPVMALYEDTGHDVSALLDEAERGVPVVQAEASGEKYTVWAITKSPLIRRLRLAFSPKPIYIADGHHRYETALNYRDRMRAAQKSWDEGAAFNFVMMTLIAFDDPGLLALPYHRLLRGCNIQRLEEHTARLFAVEEASISTVEDFAGAPEQKRPKAYEMGVYGLRGDMLMGLRVRSKSMLEDLMPRERSSAWRSLGPAIFNEAILKPVLGMDAEEAEKKGHLAFTHDAHEGLTLVKRGEWQLAFLLPPVPLSLLKQVADNGETLPPKSTYFYPKLPTGLVINHLVGKL
ncbi:MAG: DUF1015 domain-containing protein [Chloroflexi bacterium]|nr:DUF1015 domain-containing protein [Chloroflexota bacterium]